LENGGPVNQNAAKSAARQAKPTKLSTRIPKLSTGDSDPATNP